MDNGRFPESYASVGVAEDQRWFRPGAAPVAGPDYVDPIHSARFAVAVDRGEQRAVGHRDDVALAGVGAVRDGFDLDGPRLSPRAAFVAGTHEVEAVEHHGARLPPAAVEGQPVRALGGPIREPAVVVGHELARGKLGDHRHVEV